MTKVNYDDALSLGLIKVCKKCGIKTTVDGFPKVVSGKYGVNSLCFVCTKEYQKHYRKKNKERRREYYRKNKEKYKQYTKKYIQNNPNVRISRICRCRVREALRKQNTHKTDTTFDLIGCTIQELMEHLQTTAISNGYDDFDINDYDGNEYHIDHIIPCSDFDLSDPEEQKKCFNWSNQQILLASENLIKNAKLVGHDLGLDQIIMW